MFARYGKIMMHIVHGRQAEVAIDAPKNRQAILVSLKIRPYQGQYLTS
jgi:hypothetical protein